MPPGIDVTLREPVGVCVLITPWNFPAVIASWKIAPALACGNTAIVKPASQTPLTALAIADILVEAGLPEGALSVLPGPGSSVAGALVADPRVSKISFTGSTEVGTKVMQEAALHITRVSLELGGKSANVVFADTDLDVCVEKSIWSVFDNAGQDCCARSRIVRGGAHLRRVRRALRQTCRDDRGGRTARRGDRDGAVDLAGSARPRSTTSPRSGRGRPAGHRWRRPRAPGFFLLPALLADVHNDMQVAQEEIFGPVACILSFETEEEAIRMANDSPYGLSGSVWTQNLGRGSASPKGYARATSA